MSLDSIALVASNLGIVIVTGWLIMISVREAHRHTEALAINEDAENERLAKIVDDTLKREQEFAHKIQEETEK